MLDSKCHSFLITLASINSHIIALDVLVQRNNRCAMARNANNKNQNPALKSKTGNITQTCPCNILQYFTAVKMIISDENF